MVARTHWQRPCAAADKNGKCSSLELTSTTVRLLLTMTNASDVGSQEFAAETNHSLIAYWSSTSTGFLSVCLKGERFVQECDD